MQNRDRDKLNRNTGPTDAGDENHDVSWKEGQEESDSGADFGQKIGQSDHLEPDTRQSGSVDSSGMKGSENEH